MNRYFLAPSGLTDRAVIVFPAGADRRPTENIGIKVYADVGPSYAGPVWNLREMHGFAEEITEREAHALLSRLNDGELAEIQRLHKSHFNPLRVTSEEIEEELAAREPRPPEFANEVANDLPPEGVNVICYPEDSAPFIASRQPGDPRWRLTETGSYAEDSFPDSDPVRWAPIPDDRNSTIVNRKSLLGVLDYAVVSTHAGEASRLRRLREQIADTNTRYITLQ